MISYDLSIAIEHDSAFDEETGALVIRFPQSVVIYPEKNRNLPEKLKCRIIFQDGSEHVYEIPTVRIQTYSLREIREKQLFLFIPYTLLRFRSKLKTKNGLSKYELTEFLEEVKIILNEERAAGNLDEWQVGHYVDLFVKAGEQIFAEHDELQREVDAMTSWLYEQMPSVQAKRMMKQYEKELAEKDAVIDEYNAMVKEKDDEISFLKQQLAALQGC